MALISLWAAGAASELVGNKAEPLASLTTGDFIFEVHNLSDSLWVTGERESGQKLAFRTAFAPGGLKNIKLKSGENSLLVKAHSAIGDYTVQIKLLESEFPVLKYSVKFKPVQDLNVEYWPRDVVIFENAGQAKPNGEVYLSQTGTRTGLIYAGFSKPDSGSFLYLQNLGLLTAYNTDTQTSAGNTVGGHWPELGLSLPPAQGKPLVAGRTYTLSDAHVAFAQKAPVDQFEISKGFIELLGAVYLLLPRPETRYHDYPALLEKSLHDIEHNKGAWSHRSGHPYLNAYVCDYDTPPEIMVQLAVLLPVQDYMRWKGTTCSLEKDIKDGLPAFFNKKLGTVMRWLPSEEHKLDKAEEQKTPMVMDSWYLHHPLLNLARMARSGDRLAQDLLFKSVDYAIKVARHFKYCWPVFYKMDTLEVVKAETKPGEGGEKDVAGLYAHVMMQVYEITKENKYLHEAEKAAQSMRQHGFNVFYQANNTVFSAQAMVMLYKETGKELYRDLAYLFMANVLKNVAIWECNYGHAKNFPTFFALFPLSDAPYTAVYEEQEAFAGIQEFLTGAQGMELLPSLSMLLAEFVRYLVFRAVYYFPPMLPKEMLAEKAKTGEVDPNLWIALEDLHDGWEKSGEVGQEVYGAGLAFGIVPRHFMKLPGTDCMVFVDYPVTGQKARGNCLTFQVLGDSRLSCRMCILVPPESKAKSFTVGTEKGKDTLSFHPGSTQGKLEYVLAGDQIVTITWQ